MAYRVKEMFYTLQGEGMRAGRAAVFCRFAGCNLWSGREEDRATAQCRFCDTDFVGTDGVGGGVFSSAQKLAEAVLACFPNGVECQARRYVVFTGGEPTLQLDEALIEALHCAHCEIAIETNGTRPLPQGVDWITVSPKAGTTIVATKGNELKLVWPQESCSPDDFTSLDFEYFLLQPCDGSMRIKATEEAVAWCLAHPRWRLCLQTHKFLGIP